MTRLWWDNVDEGDQTVDEGLFLDMIVVGDGRGERLGGTRVCRSTGRVGRVVDFLDFDHGGGGGKRKGSSWEQSKIPQPMGERRGWCGCCGTDVWLAVRRRRCRCLA